MAGFKDLPNELYLEILQQCHPRDLLNLITASPALYRLFQWQRSRIMCSFICKLSVIPRPSEALSIAQLRLLESRCQSTQQYEQTVRFEFDRLTQFPKSGREYIEEWPSDLPTLFVLADICHELDLLTEKVRLERWDDMMLKAKREYRTHRSLGRETVPLPKKLGHEETFSVQRGLLQYELYCRLYYHGAHTLHIDSRECRKKYNYFPKRGNFFSAIQFVHNMHRDNLLELLSHDRPAGTRKHQAELRRRMEATKSGLFWIPRSEKAKFLRYLTSFGIRFATKVSQCSPPERKRLIHSEFSEFDKRQGIRKWLRPRHCFPQPDPHQIKHWRFFWDNVQFKYALDDHEVYQKRQEWGMGPWFRKSGPPTLEDEPWEYHMPDSEWWRRVCVFEKTRFLTSKYEAFLQGRYGK
ncbi:hypothetical protein PG996_004902 [Apiospora saccharicola]|uniref:F-box domain-containing protein n=1 Tax=Apiospora saccharicola TaxID=335842 RepID=A0ABR1VNS4_9PEZI